MKHADIQPIASQTLDAVTGAINWRSVVDETFEGGCRGGSLGTLAGAAVGSVAPGVGTAAGAGTGGLLGTAAGAVYGFGTSVYNTWNE